MMCWTALQQQVSSGTKYLAQMVLQMRVSSWKSIVMAIVSDPAAACTLLEAGTISTGTCSQFDLWFLVTRSCRC
jgi:hypothetical protein